MLERAVRAIETAIIKSFPGYSESTFRIEGKKIVQLAGVHHEVDVYVTATLGPGYEALFIFECKNWQDKVGKNEIIVLAEKVKVLGAQRGFFVAKSYTSDAVAQAQLDPRLELLTAVELDPAVVTVPAGFHLVQMGETNGNIVVHSDTTGRPGTLVPIDMETATLEIGGQPTGLKGYVHAWIEKARHDRCRKFPSLTVDGEQVLEFQDSRVFDIGQAAVNGKPMAVIDLKGTVKVQVIRAVVVSAFEVATRGRFITVQIDGNQLQLKADFVQIDASPSS